jgi:hypothetical protein
VSTDFGDWELDDALDQEPADPDQVAVRLHRLRVEVDALAGAAGLPMWDDLSPDAQEFAVGIGKVIVDYLISHDPDDPEPVARHLHEARRYLATSPLPPWDDLAPDDRQIGIDLMAILLNWLRRQGALV